MIKVLLIGSGAREHVIDETLLKSSERVDVYAFASANNPGLLQICKEVRVRNLNNFDALGEFVRSIVPDFAFCGPENPLADGIADYLLSYNLPTVGPIKELARLESSKSFARDLLVKYKIPGNPKFKVFFDMEGVSDFLNELNGDYVIKYDGLKGGKGVKVSGDHLNGIEEGIKYAKECIEEGGKVVIDEKLIGQEFSLMSFCDGKTVVDMPVVQDHKRAYEDDKGPNTGGMGSYSMSDHSLPFLTHEDVEEAHNINCKVAEALYKETYQYYKGILYGGFIATKDGVKLVEYNVRFGDPEVMNVLPILKTEFVKICKAIIEGKLDQINVEFENKATVCKYAVPEGYPDAPVKDKKIEVLSNPEGTSFYFASVDRRENGLYLIGSRAVAAVGFGENISIAQQLSEEAVNRISGPVFHRNDIGTKELIDKKILMMRGIKEKVKTGK